MTRDPYVFGCLVIALVGLAGCSSKPTTKQESATPPDKIQGKAQVMLHGYLCCHQGLPLGSTHAFR